MKLQARFLILFLVLFALVGSLVALQRYFDLDRSKYVLQNELKQRKDYFAKLSELDGQPLKTFSVDYSFWDDMVEFVVTPNPKFAQDNIDTGLATYGADAAWVYRLDGSLVYFKGAEDNSPLKSLNFTAGFWQRLSGSHFEQFYVRRPEGLLEVRAATIHPGDDDERRTPPRGYWVVARYLDDEYMANLSELTQSQVKIGPATGSTKDRLGGENVAFGEALPGWDGQPVAVLSSSAKVNVVADLHRIYTRQLFLLVALALASILLLVGAIWFMVLSPLRLITQSLKNQTPKSLDGLAKQSTEFGSLAQTLQQFFAQELKIKETDFIKSKLVELNQAKSEFLAIAAHELKGNVGNIHIFAENLQELLAAHRTPKATLAAEVQRISTHARKATVLINDLYQASKGGQALVLHPTKFRFDEFIHEEVADAQFSTRQHIKLSGSANCYITSDRDRLSQVMSNLLRNASKYSPDAREIRVIVKQEGRRIIVEVQDDGIGILEAEQGQVFGRFFRSRQVAGNFPGLGLGLSICKEIVEALGGKIWFHSEHQRGSQFFFSLPLDEDE
jgi:signal transduction histidine kinase